MSRTSRLSGRDRVRVTRSGQIPGQFLIFNSSDYVVSDTRLQVAELELR